MRHPSTVTSGQAGVYDAASNLTLWHDMDGGTVTSYAYYPWGQMRSLSRAGFERQYATTAGGQRIVTRDPGTGRLTVTLRTWTPRSGGWWSSTRGSGPG